MKEMSNFLNSNATTIIDYQIKANKGNTEAQYQLALCYYQGNGVAQDYVKAAKWFQEAAEQGNVNAQFNLGGCYANGNGVEKNLLEAVKWYRLSAEQGNVFAQFNLACCHANGDGVKKDIVEAIKWFQEAAEKGNPRAQVFLGNCYRQGKGVMKDPSTAKEWYLKAAMQGDAKAKFNLAMCYKDGIGVKKDNIEAAKWYTQAWEEWLQKSEQGDADAQFCLAMGYRYGEWVQKNNSKALEWLQKAANQGHKEAQDELQKLQKEVERQYLPISVDIFKKKSWLPNFNFAKKFGAKISQKDLDNPQDKREGSAASNLFTPVDSEKKESFHHSLPGILKEKTPDIVGEKYALIEEVNHKQAQDLEDQTGFKVAFKPGKTKAKIKLDKSQRKGHFGKIRIAYDMHTKKYVCAKTIEGEEKIQASKKEAELHSKVSGKPNIMRLLDSVEIIDSEGQRKLYQFMTFASFGNGWFLSEQLALFTDTDLKAKIIIHIVRGLLIALLGIHEENICHLDIKLSNFVMNHKGDVEVIDFGCAQKCLSKANIFTDGNGDTLYYSPERLACLRSKTGITGDAKEVASSYEGDKADLWAVGVTLLELILNRYPFDSTNIQRRIASWDRAYFEKHVQNITELQDPTVIALMDMIKGLLRMDPRNWFNTAAEALSHRLFQDKKYLFNSEQEQIEIFTQLKRLNRNGQADTKIASRNIYQDLQPKERNENYAHTLKESYRYFTPFPPKGSQPSSSVYPTPEVNEIFFKSSQQMETTHTKPSKQEDHNADTRNDYQYYPGGMGNVR